MVKKINERILKFQADLNYSVLQSGCPWCSHWATRQIGTLRSNTISGFYKTHVNVTLARPTLINSSATQSQGGRHFPLKSKRRLFALASIVHPYSMICSNCDRLVFFSLVNIQFVSETVGQCGLNSTCKMNSCLTIYLGPRSGATGAKRRTRTTSTWVMQLFYDIPQKTELQDIKKL